MIFYCALSLFSLKFVGRTTNTPTHNRWRCFTSPSRHHDVLPARCPDISRWRERRNDVDEKHQSCSYERNRLWIAHRITSIPTSFRYVVFGSLDTVRFRVRQGNARGRVISLFPCAARLIPSTIRSIILRRPVHTVVETPVQAATNAAMLGFMTTAAFSYAVSRAQIETTQKQLETLRDLERRSMEIQTRKQNRSKDTAV